MRIIRIAGRRIKIKWTFDPKTGKYWQQAMEGFNPYHGPGLRRLLPPGTDLVAIKNDPTKFRKFEKPAPLEPVTEEVEEQTESPQMQPMEM